MKDSIINPFNLLTYLQWEESQELEFKSGRGGLPKSLWETYSAMANTNGGIILLGVEDDGKISGIHDPATMKKNFWNTIHNLSKVNVNLLIETDIIEVPYESGTVLAIRVPRADRYNRPVYVGQNPLIGTYRRNLEGDYRCGEREISRMFSDKDQESADAYILNEFGFNNIDLVSLHQYRQYFHSYKPTHPWLAEDDKGLLTKLGGWRQDRKTSQEGLTKAGLLMFGLDSAIEEAIPNYQVDYREKLSKNPLIRWTDRLTIDGTWNANLFQFYSKVIQRLFSDLKLPFQLDNDLFRRGETQAHIAVREALVNVLIHADYQGIGGIVIEKYTDRLDFSNPGTLLISLEQLFHGNISECRNKILQKMFMMIGVSEKAGSGIDKMITGWASQHWRPPLIREQVHPDRVNCQLPMISLIPEDSLNRLRKCFKKFSNLKTLEVQILVTADLEKKVDNTRIQQLTGVHAADITRTLQGLVAKGMLLQEGQARGSCYILSCDQLHCQHKEADSQHNKVHCQHKEYNSQHSKVHCQHKEADSQHNEDNSVLNWIDTAHWSETEKILFQETITLSTLKKRQTPSETEKMIQKLCEGRWLSRMQLATLLSLHPEGLRARFLAPMIAHGLLSLRYPNKPNRVDQAYTLAIKDKDIQS